MARRSPPRKVTYFEPVPPRLARNTIIESTFEVGRRFCCTMRVDCGQLDPGAVIRLEPGGWPSLLGRQPGVPMDGKKAPTCDFPGSIRYEPEERRRHDFGLD